MLKQFFDFGKTRKPLNAALFYLFFVGCFALFSVLFDIRL